MSEIIASTYEVIEKLGSGGGGNVYLAYHRRLGKKVVLKADKRKITTRPELLRREVDILKELSHPYIPGVYDFFIEGDTVYTVMDYIMGESLDRPLKRGERFSQPQVIKWACQLLEALSYLHSPTHGEPPRGFVHSDIKPANLMRTPDHDICLIDFNIALALGEENVIGCSAGYASPEHYGLDFSSEGDTETAEEQRLSQTEAEEKTLTAGDNESAAEVHRDTTEAAVSSHGPSSHSTKRGHIVPDIRSDIYSTGATLYHLLKGQRPARNAKEVVSLSEKEFSPQIVRIITKAMNPNPDLRYQTADEMLEDFLHLHENDPRMRKFKRNRTIGGILISTLFIAGALSAFTGLKRIQMRESWLKLAEYSGNALAEGNLTAALNYALSSLPAERNLFTPAYTAESQRALTQALGVYELSEGYKTQGMIALPSAPLCMEIAPDGSTAACIYAYKAAVFDTNSGKEICAFPAEESALAEVKYLDSERMLYAANGGLTAYDIRTGKELWRGEHATSISISGDKRRAAAVYRDTPFAVVYDTHDGKVLYKADFGQKRQAVTVNDSFANPGDNLLTLNHDGSLLGVSFDDGSLRIFDLENPDMDIELFDETSGYTHFEGGFYRQYFAFSATGPSGSVFAVIDAEQAEQTGGFESDSAFSTEADETGIYVGTEHILVKIHPVTGEQIPLVTTNETIRRFARGDHHTLITTENEFQFYNENAALICSYPKEYGSSMLGIAAGTALVGSSDSPDIRIMKYEGHTDSEIFSYDPSYRHDEARISADGKTVMLFSYEGFRLYDTGGEFICDVSVPDPEQVYDQQYRRKGEDSYLEVLYNDGTILTYSAKDGTLLDEKAGEKPDLTLYEEFLTDDLLIKSPLHGTPEAYDRKSGKLIRQLASDAYLTYITQAGDCLIAQYVTTDGKQYGQLLNGKCEVLADLPYLCDVVGERLIFDYPTGKMRETRVYELEELILMARERVEKGE